MPLYSTRTEGWVVLFVLGIMVTMVLCAIAFYGTIAAVVYHFIHKFW